MNKILVITETNWLESIVLSQDTAVVYLLRLAREGKLTIAVPEYSFYEAEGSLDRKLLNRIQRIDEFLQLLKQISRTEHYTQLCKGGVNSLKEIKERTLRERKEIKRVLDEIKSLVCLIPYTKTSSVRADLRFESSKPPFKETDCRVYESILDFIRNTREYDKIIFYTTDKEDFDHPEIHKELKKLKTGIYFDSGETVQRVHELI